MKVSGGKTLYGASVGILMLASRFPRIPGDTGNAQTWPFPVLYKVVRGASPDKVVRKGAEGLLPAFIDAARDLVRDGADGITTTCGFLTLMQDELQAAVPVPVATSSLMQIPLVERLLPKGKRVGVLTISAATLTPAHFKAVGVNSDVPVVGTDEAGTEFTRVILGDEMDYDLDAARRDLLAAGDALVARHPDTGAIVLECTNMVPFAADLSAHLGVPIYSIWTFVTWFQSGLRPPRFPGTGG
jgi:Asp/Glu/hydantoin racemase